VVQRVKGSARRRGSRGPASGVRAVLREHRRKWFGVGSRWSIQGKPDEVAQALHEGWPVIVSSHTLWSALSSSRLPNDDYGRGGALDGRYWLIDEHDVFSEWTDPHPGDVEADEARDGKHCTGGRTCIRCDPANTGEQTVDVPRVPQVYDWCFLGYERHHLSEIDTGEA
jgi:hypothetical protein